MSFSSLSSSASIPTEERTSLMSEADGLVLPARLRRRYAARCFILIDVLAAVLLVFASVFAHSY